MRNNGKDAEKAFLERMYATPGTVIERLWDQADLRGLNGGRAVCDFAKPSDFIVTQKGLTFYAEVKSVQSASSFPLKNIEKGQRSAALRQAAVGGTYNFYLFSFDLGRWFLMDCQTFAKAVAEDKSSIKFATLPLWSIS
jgi:penicillin-binding protein-related factor A (putative recombinase)